MKKILVALLLALTASSAFAHGGGGYGYRGGYHEHWGRFVGPAVIGGIIGYELHNERPYRRDPVVVYREPLYMGQSVPYGYHFESILDGRCNCYRSVLVPN
jgi:hypothetical protein